VQRTLRIRVRRTRRRPSCASPSSAATHATCHDATPATRLSAAAMALLQPRAGPLLHAEQQLRAERSALASRATAACTSRAPARLRCPRPRRVLAAAPRSCSRTRRAPRAASAAAADEGAAEEAAPAGRDRFWSWPGHGRVHYEVAGDAGPPLLLLPGFGVGSFHFNAQLDALSAKHRVFAMDFLGQGESWPEEDATGLQFSAELWAQQTAAFLAEVVGEPAFVVGNSLGVRVRARVAHAAPTHRAAVTAAAAAADATHDAATTQQPC
jgi:hypothetical protein